MILKFMAMSLVLLLPGCSALTTKIEQPKVSLAHLKLQDPTAQGATVVFGLQVENPNKVPLEISRLNYNLEMSGKQLTSGELKDGAKVGAKQTAIVEIPVAFKYTDLFQSLLQLLRDQKSPYRLKGSAFVGPFEIPFDQTGELKLPKQNFFGN